MEQQSNFIEDYLDYYEGTEPPYLFRRWAAIAGISALLGRNSWVQFGHDKLYPNLYMMLVGESGSRKSTAIKNIKSLLQEVGYKKIAASKTTKEKFLLDLEAGMDMMDDAEDYLDVTKNLGDKNPTMKALFGVEVSTEPAECLIAADEFNTFMGHSNVEFIDLLTELYDFEGIYDSRIKNGRSVRVPYPTIVLFGGNTNVGISMSFPTEVIGQGFFSRLLLIFSEPSGRRVHRPPPRNEDKHREILEKLLKIKATISGEFTINRSADKALETIYNEWKDLDDVRFKSYSTRRYTHLLKLCMVCAAARGVMEITSDIVEYANSILHYTESFMPKSLGEFGKARHSDVTSKILELLDKADHPLDIQSEIWPQVRRDIETIKQLGELLQGLKAAGKIQQVGSGLLPLKKPQNFDFPYTKVNLLREFMDQQQRDQMI